MNFIELHIKVKEYLNSIRNERKNLSQHLEETFYGILKTNEDALDRYVYTAFTWKAEQKIIAFFKELIPIQQIAKRKFSATS